MTDDPTSTAWRKSSHSGSGNACVELLRAADGFAVRDSKNPAAGMLAFPDRDWPAFHAAVTGGQPAH